MKKKIFAVVMSLSLCMLCIVGTGCNGGKTKLRVSEVTHSIFYAPMYLAENLGYFDEEGLDVTISNAGGADKVMNAVASGSVEIGLMGPEATIYCHVEGQRNYPIIFGQLTNKDGSFLVGRNPEPNFKWSDLRGKHVLAGRAGGMPAMILEYACNQNGLKKGTDVNLDTSVAFDAMVGAFLNDTQYDYCTMFEPTASEQAATGKCHIVAAVGDAGGEIPYTAFSASKSYLEKNRDTALAFLRAVFKGYKYLTEHTPEEVAPYLEPSFVGMSLTSIAAAVKNYLDIGAYASSPVLKEADFNHLMDIMESAGTLSSRADFSKAVDNSIAAEVLAG